MLDVKEKPQMIERSFLVGVYQRREEEEDCVNLTEELGDLVRTLGVGVVGSKVIKVAQFNPRTLLGSGQFEEVLDEVKEAGADSIIFDHELSPSQQRNLEALAKISIFDRHEIILDIFSRHATTREAKLQVELARLEYFLPRLAKAWSHLGRQGGRGGTGAKGEGEQQIELDRRIVRNQISKVKTELEHVKKVRATQRKERSRIPIPNAAIVGYTNAGKSSLLRALTGADVLIEDKLFATLDTTTRKVSLPNGHPLLLTDTVGFVRNLPHRLVEAFKATLEEAVLADFLVHVLDVSNPRVHAFYETTLDVLKELGADQKRIITVFNKTDRLENPTSTLSTLRLHYPEALFVSVHRNEGLEPLLARMADLLSDRLQMVHCRIPFDRGEVLSMLHEQGKILETRYEEDHTFVSALIPTRFQKQFEPYQVAPEAS